MIQARERLFGISRDTAARLTPTGAAATTMEAGRTVQGFLELARNSDPVKPTFINHGDRPRPARRLRADLARGDEGGR